MATNDQRRIQPGDRERRPRRTLRRRLVLLLLLLATAVSLAPMFVAKTPLRNTLLGWAMPAAGWRIESREASLTWLGEQTLAGVTIVDPGGKPFLTVESITLDRSLLALAADRNNLGKAKLQRLVAYVVTRPDGSNVEDLLADVRSYRATAKDSNESSSQSQRNLEIEIVAGEIRGLDAPSQTQWLLDEANLTVQLGEAIPGGLGVEGLANFRTTQDGAPGRLKFRLRQIAENQQQLDLLAENLSLVPFQPWLARTVPGCRLAGSVSSDTQVRWTNDPKRGLLVQTSGRLEANGLEASADVLAGDHLRFEQLAAPWQLSMADGIVTIGQLEMDAGWAQLQARGAFSWDDFASLSLANLPKRETAISGRIQLAPLAAMLPRSLQLREGVRIDSGELAFHAEGKPQDGGFAWLATAAMQNVAGSDGQRAIRWQQPIEAKIELADTNDGPRMKQLSLASPFAKADFQTASKDITGSFELDLGQFSEELGQFVDLDAWQIRGLGKGNLTLARGQNNQFDVAAEINLTDLNVTQDGRLIWAEPRLQVDLQAAGQAGQANDLTPRQIDTASVKLRGVRDSLEMQLLDRVDLSERQQSWKLQVQGDGPLSSWADRLRPWVAATFGEIQEIAGEAHVSAKLQVARNMVHVIESEIDVAQLRVRSGTMVIDEPRVTLSGDCRWDAVAGSLATREMQLVSSTLAFRSRDVSLQLASSGEPTATGRVAFRADLQRLALAAGIVGQRGSTWPRGMTAGNLRLTSNAQQLEADFSATTQQLQIVRTLSAGGAAYGRPEIVWIEPQLQTVGKAVYVIAEDRLQLENLEVNGQTMRVNGSVTIDALATKGLLQANGLVEYDPEKLAKLAATYLGPEIYLQGDRQVRFQVAGRLVAENRADVAVHWSRRWNVSADAGWNAATVFGLPLNASRLQVTLSDGQLQFAPLDVAIGQGRLTASPRVLFDPGPGQLYFPQGPLIRNVRISPQVSETILKYVAPVVAGATRSEGLFSIDLDSAQVPLDDPRQARAAGRLAIHQLNVSPGPMIAQLATLVKQIEAVAQRKQFLQAAASPGDNRLLTIRGQQIDFQVSEGRVYHRNLEFVIDNVPVRSHGSVGLDQTLSLVVEIPIQDRWVERQQALRSLAGQTLQIPIRGTFQKPRIDQRAIADLSRQLLQNVATEAIGGEINRALDKLFKSR